MISLCNDWEFVRSPDTAFLAGRASGEAPSFVRLPHTVSEVPLHYAAPEDYAGIYGYRKHIEISDLSKRYFIQFDGAAHAMTLYVNGREAGAHFCGYTAYRKEITEYLREGTNLIAVKLDTTERADVPPFGFVMDYLGYGGLYREAWLDIKKRTYIEDVFVQASHLGDMCVWLTIDGKAAKAHFRLLDGDRLVDKFGYESPQNGGMVWFRAEGIEPWSPENPKLYTFETFITDENGGTLDKKVIKIGFRTAEFKADGLYLNGEKYFMRGLDRHQCWPYIGYAAPASLQYEDARILKEELCVNAVRTSHYPQSRAFISACDELGLLVFTEIPGWQHIGDEAWKERSLENVRDMVLQNRNHPSIILWGVRINESRDDDEFYKRANEIAHELDPSRATSGVRFIRKSSLLEDVYAFNDFSHSGNNAGCLKKKAVMPDMKKALLISEHSGHMFPTKAFDVSTKRQEHALRHARVLSAAASSGEHAGCFGWCMFDYATHEEFGSGDRICYHGVMDAFRNPKLAAAVYASQGEDTPVLEIGSSMDIGDYPASIIGDVYVFTNADEVELYKDGRFVTVYRPEKGGLPHPPILMDDIVGRLLEKDEGVTGRKEKLLRDSLNAAHKYGMDGLPIKYKLKMARLMLFHGVTYDEGVRLYGKYVGNWGVSIPEWRFVAKKGGRITAEAVRKPSHGLRLEVKVSKTGLREGATYDMASIRIRVLDENGAAAPYAQLPVKLELSGAAELVGPDTVTAEGGMCGTYIRTKGEKGIARLKLSTPQTDPEIIYFDIK